MPKCPALGLSWHSYRIWRQMSLFEGTQILPLCRRYPSWIEKIFHLYNSSLLGRLRVEELATLPTLEWEGSLISTCLHTLEYASSCSQRPLRESKKSLVIFVNAREFISGILLSASATTLYRPLQYLKRASYSWRISAHLTFQPFKSAWFVN